MSEFTTKNPTLETENNSVGSVDNSTKQTEEIQSTQAVWHNFSSNEQSNAIICKPHNGELIPNGLTDLDGKPLYSRGPYDYRFGIYTVYGEDGKAMDPKKVWNAEQWKDKVIPNVVIRYDMPVPDGNGNPIVDDQGRPCVFYAFDKNAIPV
tara:strand:- start:29 stop:481 length:453 start_codon:yes stop_codon:yes gene_type:complete